MFHSRGVFALDIVPLRQEVVEAGYELWVASEEAGDPGNQSRHVDGLLVERLHDAQEVFVHMGLLAELGLYLVQVCEGILNFPSLELNLLAQQFSILQKFRLPTHHDLVEFYIEMFVLRSFSESGRIEDVFFPHNNEVQAEGDLGIGIASICKVSRYTAFAIGQRK